jgi:hypothetical protein
LAFDAEAGAFPVAGDPAVDDGTTRHDLSMSQVDVR